MKIFWAWQSDTPGKIGRFFVRDVLNAAIKQLRDDLEVVEPTEREVRDALELDHDRKGVPGSPDLARTILEKIEAASVFVADMTPVGEVPADDNRLSKKLINSNVAIELGYALSIHTDRSVLMVMNTHYGTRVDLPFDVAHKGGPIMFNLAPDADRKTIAEAGAELRARLVEAIELCITDHVEEQRESRQSDLAGPFVGPATFFRNDEVLASAGYAGEQEFRFPYDRVAYLRIHSTAGRAAPGRARIAKFFNSKQPRVMSPDGNGIAFVNEHGAIIFDYEGSTSITALTQGFRTGELWGVTAQVFRVHELNSGVVGTSNRETILPVVTFERVFVQTLRNYIEVEKALDLPPPYTVTVGVVGLKGTYLAVPTGGPFGHGDFIGPIRENVLQRGYTLTATDSVAVNNALRDYFNELYDLAYAVRADVWTDELIAKWDLPSRETA